ncbi:MAG: alpha/beta hydrolase [Aliishimia sp.]
MKKFLRAMAIMLSAAFVCVAFVWVVLPEKMTAVLLTLNNASAGLSAKIVKTELGNIHYLEGGQGETIVLIHGIYARKEHWVDLARHLTEDYHVIAIDLPGFGDNETLRDNQYLIGRQQINLLAVLDALDIDTAHIAANSMGAYVATLLATANPSRVSSFAFIGSPLGVPTRIKSDMDWALERGRKPLVAGSEPEFHARMAWLSPNPPYVPGPILNTWMNQELAMAQTNDRIWDVVHTQSKAPTVLELAPELTMKTLIIWCRPDRIFHVSGAKELAKRLKKQQLSILDQCGHVPMLDQPESVAAVYLAFLKTADQ